MKTYGCGSEHVAQSKQSATSVHAPFACNMRKRPPCVLNN